MPDLLTSIVAPLRSLRESFAAIRDLFVFGPLLVDRGHGLMYDVLRDVTWLQDANYARTVGRTPDGQMTWNDARTWVAGLSYRGIRGWRLPDARTANGSGPHEVENSPEGEFGHLFLVASTRKSPPDLALKNFEPYAIYWYRNEASANEAWGFKTVGLEQGRLAKDPWADEVTAPIAYKILAWPVHDGDVGARVLVRFITRLFSVFLRRA